MMTPMRTTWTFHSAGKLVFGPGSVTQLGELATELGCRRLFVVTDRTLVAAGIYEAVRAPLAEAGITLELFDGGVPDPSIDLAEQTIALAKAFAPDGVVGVGGGSNMDLAKVVATVLAHGGGTRDMHG